MDYRTEQVDRAQQQVAHEETKRQDILNQIHTIDRAVEGALNDYNNLSSREQLDLGLSQRMSHYVRRLKDQRNLWEVRQKTQEETLRKARQVLQDMMMKQKSLELLKDKEFQRFKQHIQAEEEKFLSELALNRHRRSSRLYSGFYAQTNQ